MNKDGGRQEHLSTLAAPLALLTRLVLHRPWVTIAIGGVLAVASLLVATGWLNLRTSRLDLLNPDSSFNHRWLAYLDEFGDVDDVVIVVDGTTQLAVTSAMDELARVLEHQQGITSVLQKIDLSALRSKGLYYLTNDELQQVEHFLAEFQPVLAGDWSRLGVGHALHAANCHPAQPSASAALTPPTEPLRQLVQALRGEADSSRLPEALSDLEQLEERLASHHLLLNDGLRGMVLLRLATRENSVSTDQAIRWLRKHMDEIARQHPDVQLGMTGMPILEHDEMASSQRDSARASVLSLLGVSLVFIAGFQGMRRPLLAVAALLIGIAWSLGYITLAVGHLNILSVAFGVILIGLGIDFGIHFLACYLQQREQMEDVTGALIETSRCVGPGIICGGLTSALAFFTAGLTEFTGIAELGIIAGGGILLCVLAALTMLPALLEVTDRHRVTKLALVDLPFAPLCHRLASYPRSVLFVIGGLTVVLALGLPHLHYDHNLLNLQPRNQESVELECKLATTSDRSVWFAVSLCRDREELFARKAKLQALSTVIATEEIVSLLPADDPARHAAIARIAQQLAALPDHVPLLPVVDRESLLRGVAQMAQVGPAASPDSHDVAPTTVLTPQDLDDIGRLESAEYFARVSQWQQHNAQRLLETLWRLRSMASPIGPMIGDLPEPLAQRYIGRTGRHLLKIYGHSDIWNMEALAQFVRDVESVDPNITGHPIQTYYASSQMQKSYLHAAIYSFLAVSIVLMLDFHSIRYSLLAMLPMGLGFVQLLGLLAWLDISLNPANMIVLPLILGIGIDDGVHVVHDSLRQGDDYQISRSTASAVFLTSATTMIGFGSMMIASHQGLRSLGQVLTLGVFCCLVSSVFVLPVLLRKRRLSSQ